MAGVPIGKPGMLTTYVSQPRDIFFGNGELASFIPVPITVDGTLTSNPSNSPYTWDIFSGTVMGQVTATRKFTNAILGLTSGALGGGQTTLNTDANTATEIVRRIGTSGTFTLTGGPTTNGAASAVRSKTITYSAVNTSTGAITITADAAGAVSAVNQINNLPFVDSSGSGTFTITVEGITTGAITYSATVATLNTNINNALNAAFGTSAIVASGASLAAVILTFSGTGYSGRPVGTVQATVLAGSTGYTINGSGTVGTPSTSTVNTAGVTAVAADEGEFATGSLIQPTDGSQTIKTLLVEEWGLKVIDQINTNRIDVFGKLWAGGGVINTGYIVNYPADTGLQAYLKSQIKNYVANAQFHDDYL